MFLNLRHLTKAGARDPGIQVLPEKLESRVPKWPTRYSKIAFKLLRFSVSTYRK